MKDILSTIIATVILAQSFGQDFVRLKEFVHNAESKYGTSFSFNSNLLEGVMVQNAAHASLEEVVEIIEVSTAFKPEKVGATIVLKPVVPGKNLKLHLKIVDSTDGGILYGASVYNQDFKGFVHRSAWIRLRGTRVRFATALARASALARRLEHSCARCCRPCSPARER